MALGRPFGTRALSATVLQGKESFVSGVDTASPTGEEELDCGMAAAEAAAAAATAATAATRSSSSSYDFFFERGRWTVDVAAPAATAAAAAAVVVVACKGWALLHSPVYCTTLSLHFPPSCSPPRTPRPPSPHRFFSHGRLPFSHRKPSFFARPKTFFTSHRRSRNGFAVIFTIFPTNTILTLQTSLPSLPQTPS